MSHHYNCDRQYEMLYPVSSIFLFSDRVGAGTWQYMKLNCKEKDQYQWKPELRYTAYDRSDLAYDFIQPFFLLANATS